MGFVSSTAYWGIALLMFVENVFPPVPSELIMPLAGYMVSQRELSLAGVIVAGIIGSVAGALPLYYIGRQIGEHRLKRLADRHGRWFTVCGRDIDTAIQRFRRHGAAATFVCRLIPGVRSLISVPAGIARMNLAAFVLYTALGSALWSGALAYAGYALGVHFEKVGEYLDPVSWIALTAIAVWYVIRVIRFERSTA
jgi:membrane protein DedA with SNARE-associated domain